MIVGSGVTTGTAIFPPEGLTGAYTSAREAGAYTLSRRNIEQRREMIRFAFFNGQHSLSSYIH